MYSTLPLRANLHFLAIQLSKTACGPLLDCAEFLRGDRGRNRTASTRALEARRLPQPLGQRFGLGDGACTRYDQGHNLAPIYFGFTQHTLGGGLGGTRNRNLSNTNRVVCHLTYESTNLELATGIKPATSALQGRRSVNASFTSNEMEAPPGVEPGPRGYEPRVLPPELRSQLLVDQASLDLASSPL